MSAPAPLPTWQDRCYDVGGREIPCAGSGQDAARPARPAAPAPRFAIEGEDLVRDGLTGLVWTRDANLAEFPLGWQEALETAARMGREGAFGRSDWRVPNRRELRSLVDHQQTRPPLPAGHPFRNVFPGWYWTSTSAAVNPAFAWYLHLGGARMFYGEKRGYALLWPVAGDGDGLPRTGQRRCFDEDGRSVPCEGTGQDGGLLRGRPWPETRFHVAGGGVEDLLTGLTWRRDADLCREAVSWEEAIEAVRALARAPGEHPGWRLPDINELESLVDCERHSPALPDDHPFSGVAEEYWSSTTSVYEPDWAWALYLRKGAVGVGQKRGRHFRVWAVRDAAA